MRLNRRLFGRTHEVRLGEGFDDVRHWYSLVKFSCYEMEKKLKEVYETEMKQSIHTLLVDKKSFCSITTRLVCITRRTDLRVQTINT